jgi:hypothetical protein
MRGGEFGMATLPGGCLPGCSCDVLLEDRPETLFPRE